MDTETLKELLKEAEDRYKLFEKKIDKYENSEDFEARDAWEHAVIWLKTKIKYNKKPT